MKQQNEKWNTKWIEQQITINILYVCTANYGVAFDKKVIFLYQR